MKVSLSAPSSKTPLSNNLILQGESYRFNYTGEGVQTGENLSPKTVFRIVEKAMKECKKIKTEKLVIDLEGYKADSNTLSLFQQAFDLANYSFEIKSKEDKKSHVVKELAFEGVSGLDYDKMEDLKFQKIVSDCKLMARDLGNRRANDLTTEVFLEEAKKVQNLFPEKVELTFLKKSDLIKEGLNLHVSVGKGSNQEPILVCLTFKNKPNCDKVQALVGKGLIFDNGGLHVKPYGFMEDMYTDKAGAAAALSIFKGAVQANLPLNLTCVLGLAENSISEEAYRPSDIIKSHSVSLADCRG